jgi:ABC-type nitrate/sulfonate/bicarbonate transport system permease component
MASALTRTLLSPPRRRAAVGLAGLALLWEGLVRLLELPAYVMPTVSAVLASMVSGRAGLAANTWTTTVEAVGGFAIGSLLGVALAVFIVMQPWLRRALLPVLMAANSVPVVAYAPLVLLWFGVGIESKVAMVALAVGFTVMLHAITGFDQVDGQAVALMRSFGADRAAILWRLSLPTAAPMIATGMRVATVRSVIIAIVTEMLGSASGLGWTIYQGVLQVDFVQVWSGIFAASALSLLFFAGAAALERRVIFWRR